MDDDANDCEKAIKAVARLRFYKRLKKHFITTGQLVSWEDFKRMLNEYLSY